MTLLGIGTAAIVIGFILMLARTYDVRSSGLMIFVAGLLFLLAFGISKALAEEAPKSPANVTCWTVRKAVKIYSEADLIAMARAAGVSEAEIEKAKRCLK